MIIEGLLGIYVKLVPFLLLVSLGLVAAKLKVERKSTANLAIFIMTPVIYFNLGLNISGDPRYLLLPLMNFCTSVILCLGSFVVFKKLWKGDKSANVLAYAAGSGNTGYLGLPIAMLFFQPEIVAVYAIARMGSSVYEYTVGAYVIARGSYSTKDAFFNILKLPMLHAFFLGFLARRLGFEMPAFMAGFFKDTQSCYSVLGMMLIGLSLVGVSYSKVNLWFVGSIVVIKALISPSLTLMIIFIDSQFLGWFTSDVHKAMLLLSLMPVAVNTVIFATMYNNSQAEAAISVLVGIFAAMLLFPFCI